MSGGEGFYMTDNYVGTRRGRSNDADIGYEMFPEKYEATPITENPGQLNMNWRDILKDHSPDDGTFAHEAARRNNYSRDRLNVRSGGARSNVDPWQNEGFDTQFHDHDPRGWTGEVPWDEYRRVQEKMMSMIDFKDDGDYSVPSEGIHPNTMYKNIKAAFHWTKSRMKWFATAKDNFHNGGIGKYKWQHASTVPVIDVEDTSSMVDPRYMEAAGRQHKTTQLSNIVNTGSKFLRANTTTDQEVKVASYGKLMAQRGIINHENQLRQVADDTPLSKLEGMQTTPANVVALMASGAREGSAASALCKGRQEALGDPARIKAVSEQQVATRNRQLTNEIMSLLGFTPQEVKWLESYEGVNAKAAQHLQANLMKLTELVHNTPANVKLAMRDELMMESVGRGLCPANPSQLRRARDRVILNPKILEFMDMMTRSTPAPGDPDVARRNASGDPESKLDNPFAAGPLFTTRGRYTEEVDIDSNRRSTTGEKGMGRGKRERRTKSYATLARSAEQAQKNRQAGINVQELQDTVERLMGKNLDQGNTRPVDKNSTNVDNDFGENQTKDRHGGHMGSKYMRRHMDTEDRVLSMMETDAQVRRGSNRGRVNG